MNNSPVFLISTGRTGTKFLSHFFSNYCKDVASYHTSHYTRLLNVLGNLYYFNLIDEDLMQLVWKRLKYRSIISHRFRYIESNPYYYNCINIIEKLFPEAKIIWITREPKSFIISHIKWELQRYQSRIANCLVPFWQPVSYLEQLQGLKNYFYQRVSVYSKIWARKNLAIEESLQKRNNYRLIKFEEIFYSDSNILQMNNLLDWLKLKTVKPINREMLSGKLNSTLSLKQSWDKKCDKIMQSHCKSMMRKLEY